jgi:hypothetical protein
MVACQGLPWAPAGCYPGAGGHVAVLPNSWLSTPCSRQLMAHACKLLCGLGSSDEGGVAEGRGIG